MAARYDFEREDGEVIEMVFPFGQCPKEITCPDGVKAHRVYAAPGVAWKAGQEPPSVIAQMRESRTRDNINAGNRGRADWRERSPKLVDTR